MALNHTQAVLTAYLNRLQELENAAWALLAAISINGAVAAGADDLLNKIGNIVGEARNGRANADYAAGIKLRVRVNISSGRAVDLVDIARLAYAPLVPTYIEPGVLPGWIVDMPFLTSASVGMSIVQQLRRARPAGVAGVVSFSSTTNPIPFILDSTVAGAVTSPGKFDDVGGDLVGPGAMTVGLSV